MKFNLLARTGFLGFCFIALLLCSCQITHAEEIKFGFWNVENLFDTDDDPKHWGDDQYLPAKGWTKERYQLKLKNISEVIAELDCHILGFCELENKRVLEDLINTKALKKYNYKIIHKDSPDKRGIDVGLIYRAPLEFKSIKDAAWYPLVPNENSKGPSIERPSRDILCAKLHYKDQSISVLVNHWPSRGGGEKSVGYRALAAELCKTAVLKAFKEDADANLLVLGDFNDDPFDASVRHVLGAIRSKNCVLNNKRGGPRLYNPSWKFLGQTDLGTLYYNRGWTWNVFDQCIISRALLTPEGLQLKEGSLSIFAPDRLRDHYRRPKWFRKKGKKWHEGYSDHFAIHGVLSYSTKKAKSSSEPKKVKQ